MEIRENPINFSYQILPELINSTYQFEGLDESISRETFMHNLFDLDGGKAIWDGMKNSNATPAPVLPHAERAKKGSDAFWLSMASGKFSALPQLAYEMNQVSAEQRLAEPVQGSSTVQTGPVVR